MNDSPPHILIVEDDPDLSAVMSAILEDAGYRTTHAENGARALEHLEQELPDLILLDMCMPVMNGWELAAHLRERHGYAIPIVVVTAAENARRWAEEVSADAWVSKPFDLDDLLERIRTTLGAPTHETAPAPS